MIAMSYRHFSFHRHLPNNLHTAHVYSFGASSCSSSFGKPWVRQIGLTQQLMLAFGKMTVCATFFVHQLAVVRHLFKLGPMWYTKFKIC